MKSNSSQRYRQYKQTQRKKRSNKLLSGCLTVFLKAFLIALVIIISLSVYFFIPQRTNILLLGLDYAPPNSTVARTDTIIVSTFATPPAYVGLLSIPRDLWIPIRNVGSNRINTAHFFAEAQQPGSGPYATIQAIQDNFGIKSDYFVRLRFEGFREIVDAMGGLDIKLDKPMAGYEAGNYHLTGRKALAFARNRRGSDDFYRMEQGQLIIKSIYKQLLKPTEWPRIPAVLIALSNSIDTNVPNWLWPRIGLILLRVGIDNIDSHTITREMTIPTVTEQGASVLLPKWELILPLVNDIFGN
jgi:LCP family protein required for cell wall assembly